MAEDHVDVTRGGMRGGSVVTGVGIGASGPSIEQMAVSSSNLENETWGRRQRQDLKLAEDMMAQGKRVVNLIEIIETLYQKRGEYKLNGRYL